MKFIAGIFVVFLSMNVLSSESALCSSYASVLGKLLWSADNFDLNVEVGLPKSDSASFEAEISFCKEEEVFFSYKGGASFVAMFPLSENSKKIISVWVSGNGTYLVRIFGYIGGKVRLLLDVPSLAMPELVYPHGANVLSEPVVIVSMRKPSSQTDNSMFMAGIYGWDGKSYANKGVFGWDKRLRQLE